MIGYTTKFSDLDQIWIKTPPRADASDLSQASDWQRIDTRIRELTQLVSSFREDVKKHILENDHPNPYDWIQHRFILHQLLADLDGAFLDATRAPRATKSDQDRLAQALSSLDGLQKPLYREFIEWHGKLEDQADIPLELIQAFHEADAGKVIDMEKALNDAPPPAD